MTSSAQGVIPDLLYALLAGCFFAGAA